MAEKRQKTHTVLLTINGKNTLVETFAADLWPNENTGEGLYRVRVNGKWHCPVGKYSFLPLSAVGAFCTSLLAGGEVAEPPRPPRWIKKGMEVRVDFGECMGGLPMKTYLAVVADGPQFGPDGRWYVDCRIYTVGRRFVPVDDITPARAR